jgi:hypothetical protein
MRKVTVLTAVLLIISFRSLAAVINVPSQYSTIQAAINASVNGDTVLVEPGTYNENINFRGKRIVLTSRFFLTLDPATINSTIINGGSPLHPDTASCVIISSGEDSTTVLQGFTLTGGTGTLWDDEHAPGNRFREGGGLLIQYSKPVIQNNIIRNNFATNLSGAVGAGGGGIRMGDSYPRFYNNIIMQNQARYGPGIVLNYSGGVFKNNIICFNSGGINYNGGGAFWILSSSTAGPIVIENNSIINNSCTSGCGGISIQVSVVTIRNNIIRGNFSTNSNQIDLLGGTVNASFNNIQGGYAGTGNINADPLYADSNYVLQPGSPCIDKGDSSVIYNDVADPNNPSAAKYPSRGGLRNDMGAYGGPLTRILTNQLIGINEPGLNIPEGFVLEQNYPNPFNPSTVISYSLPVNGFIELKIFDILGNEITVLENGFKQAGNHSVNFNASGLSSGIYFYTLKSGEFTLTKKMMLLK